MMNLFDYQPEDDTPTPSQEEALGQAMRKQWQEDQQVVRERGIIPDWVGEPSPLSKDKARLLNLLYESGSITWSSGHSQNNRDVTSAMGLQSTGNAKAVIDMCYRDKLITSRIYRGSQIFELTLEGEFALEEHLQDRDWETM